MVHLHKQESRRLCACYGAAG